jgi:hypothetical protein
MVVGRRNIMAKLIVTLEITMGEGKPKDYIGLIDEMLEESNHWGDFSCDVVAEWIADEDTGETYAMSFLKENLDMFEDREE